ncbi:uroporphyrinogen decarboxylase family protein [Candidatus Neomarinimicrobiota bacterium]
MDTDLSHKDRVNQAISFIKPDRTPRDFAAVPEVWEKLGDYFGVHNREQIMEYLDTDCRTVSYDSFCRHPTISISKLDKKDPMERSSIGGPWKIVEPDGSSRDIWGAHRQKFVHKYGAYDKFVSYPLEDIQVFEDLNRYEWPQPEWWDFSSLRPVIDALNKNASYNIRYRVGSVFETAWSLYGFEKFLTDLAIRPKWPLKIMEKIAQVHFANLKVVLETSADQIDIVYFYDDVASQNSLLISPQMYKDFIQPFHRKIINISKNYGKPVMMHCCGSIYPLIEEFIEMGLSILNPIQPSALNMNPERLTDEFGGRIAFHGGIDILQLLPSGTPTEIEEQVQFNSQVLGKNGGYILAGSHHIQADTPVENILAMYDIR